ncbi:hypothetical protein MFFC18_21530 [Mariniblastus fucicola]|uniref:Uncharacterized protein n=1 Tax=Mariniblastus fucicola TaxID=980251 RepID=A0A5B9P6P5_9BACT|nr:hypothetical protein MFFC18_21530 [Mariniblastus fucicola]
MHVGARCRMSTQRSLNLFEPWLEPSVNHRMHVGARSIVKKRQVVTDRVRLQAFCVFPQATICEAKSIQPPQDNVRVNRADLKT